MTLNLLEALFSTLTLNLLEALFSTLTLNLTEALFSTKRKRRKVGKKLKQTMYINLACFLSVGIQ